MQRTARSALVVALAVGFLLVPGTAAWAPHVPQLQVTPSQVRPGEEVAVYGTRGFGFTNPVEVRFDAPDGPVLGSFQPTNEPYAPFGPGTVRIPEGLAPGTYSLWATQLLSPAEKHIRGVPARSTITVLGPGGTPVLGAQVGTLGDEGSAGLARQKGPSAWSLVLVGLGVAGVAVFIAGLFVAASSRRTPTAAEPMKSRS
jgi:hypothetical protein